MSLAGGKNPGGEGDGGGRLGKRPGHLLARKGEGLGAVALRDIGRGGRAPERRWSGGGEQV